MKIYTTSWTIVKTDRNMAKTMNLIEERMEELNGYVDQVVPVNDDYVLVKTVRPSEKVRSIFDLILGKEYEGDPDAHYKAIIEQARASACNSEFV